MNARDCKSCTRGTVLLMGPYAFLVKASMPPVSKVRQFLHSKPSYTKSALATSKYKRMTAFARFKNKIWCMDLTFVDKLIKHNHSVYYLLFR